MKRVESQLEKLAEANQALSKAVATVFDVIREVEDDESYLITQPNVAAWVAWNLGLAPATARRWFRIAEALRDLPNLERAFHEAEISIDQIEVLIRVATPANERELLQIARDLDVPELKAHVRSRLQRQAAQKAEDANEASPEPYMVTRWHDDVMKFDGAIPGADGVVVETALMRLAQKAPKDTATGLYRDHEVRMGEAMVQMASESLAEERDHDRATIVIHIPAADVASEAGAGWDAAQRWFGSAELKRLLCDSRVQPAIHDPAGVTVGVGRVTRSIDPWLRRLVEDRDGICRFPGCDRSRWTQVHHILEWAADNGPTNLDNLVLLCGFHHRLIHRERWEILGDPNGELIFLDKFGVIHQPVRNRFPPDWDEYGLRRINAYFKRRLAEVAQRPPA